jgi:hypothetical protein
VPSDTARTALLQRPDVEIAWEHRLFDILADFGEGRDLMNDLPRDQTPNDQRSRDNSLLILEKIGERL